MLIFILIVGEVKAVSKSNVHGAEREGNLPRKMKAVDASTAKRVKRMMVW